MAGLPDILGLATEVPHSTGTAPPTTPSPPGAVDCHHHVFDPCFPPAPGKHAPVATAEQYGLMRRRLGLTRSVVVAASTYGDDNRCLLDALDRLGETARGIAIVAPDVSATALRELHRRRIRGIRIYLGRGTPPTPDILRDLGCLIADLSWNMEVVVSRETRLLSDAEGVLQTLPCRVVIDHFGFVRPSRGPCDPGRLPLLRLLASPHVSLKLSGPYHVSDRDDGADVAPFARELVELAADRLVWGSDWPHTQARGHKPDDALLLDLLGDWTSDMGVRRRILVDNPDRLYFSP